MKARCFRCRHFQPEILKSFPEAHGTCRRYAPQGPAVRTESGGWAYFPPVNVHSGCAEYVEIRAISPAAQQRNRELNELVKARAEPTQA